MYYINKKYPPIFHWAQAEPAPPCIGIEVREITDGDKIINTLGAIGQTSGFKSGLGLIVKSGFEFQITFG